jgi:pterin-4a-carbinolamine dehydratase
MSANASPLAVSSPVPSPLKAERIQLQMQQLPEWHLSHNSRRAQRKFQFPSRRRAIDFLRQVIRYAECVPIGAGRPGPGLSCRRDSVTVSICAHDGAFLEAEIAMARNISRLI